jgi:hypothetical protein
LCFRHQRPAPFRWAAPAQQNPYNSSSVSVSVKPPLQKFPHIAEAAREPKPSARPDVDKASEGHFPQQGGPRRQRRVGAGRREERGAARGGGKGWVRARGRGGPAAVVAEGGCVPGGGEGVGPRGFVYVV